MEAALVGLICIVSMVIGYITVAVIIFVLGSPFWEWLDGEVKKGWIAAAIILTWPVWLIPALFATYHVCRITGEFVMGVGI